MLCAQCYDDEVAYDQPDMRDDDDGLDDCGMMADGHCMLAGTEFCDWECPRGC
jgi:hypothetical protein